MDLFEERNASSFAASSHDLPHRPSKDRLLNVVTSLHRRFSSSCISLFYIIDFPTMPDKMDNDLLLLSVKRVQNPIISDSQFEYRWPFP